MTYDAHRFRELAKEIDPKLDFIAGTLEGRDFWFLAREDMTMYRQRPGARRPAQKDQLLRIELKKTRIKVSGLVGDMERWEREIKSLPEPGFSLNRRTTKRHIERTTFTGFPEAFDSHRPFLKRFIQACARRS